MELVTDKELVAEIRCWACSFASDRDAGCERYRVADLEKLLGDSRGSGKRQAAPFLKGAPTEERKLPGRKSGTDHGRRGHRMHPLVFPTDNCKGLPDRQLQARLPGRCPGFGGEIDRECDAEQFHVELPELVPVVTWSLSVSAGVEAFERGRTTHY